MFDGFQEHRVQTSGAEIFLRTRGSGPAVLMIHGYPQCHVIWRYMAPKLAAQFTVVCPDLRGYGDSACPPTDDTHTPYSKRAMAQDLVEVMSALGHETFAVVGHDRGARVGYRLCLDHPERVTRYCSFDVVPTGSVWNNADKNWSMGTFHWPFLAQPSPKPETLIGADPDFFLTWLVESWAQSMDGINDAMEIYKEHFRKPGVIHGTCEDYRAGATLDDDHDQADLAAGNKLSCPVMALKGGGRSVGVGATAGILAWHDWAEDVTLDTLPCGHFIPEEMPDAALERLLPFLTPDLRA